MQTVPWRCRWGRRLLHGLDIRRKGKTLQERTETQVRTSSWTASDSLRVFLVSSERNTHLLHVAFLAVTELQVILEHARRSNRLRELVTFLAFKQSTRLKTLTRDRQG